MNKYDENGKRHGYWEDGGDSYKWKGYYNKGNAVGLWKRYLEHKLERECFYDKNNIILWTKELIFYNKEDSKINSEAYRYSYFSGIGINTNLKHIEDIY